jgi:hypothetical protein
MRTCAHIHKRPIPTHTHTHKSALTYLQRRFIHVYHPYQMATSTYTHTHTHIHTHTQEQAAHRLQSTYRGHLHRAIFRCPFAGAGLVLSHAPGRSVPVVAYVVEGGPAHKHVFEGDEVHGIDGARCPEVRTLPHPQISSFRRFFPCQYACIS